MVVPAGAGADSAVETRPVVTMGQVLALLGHRVAHDVDCVCCHQVVVLVPVPLPAHTQRDRSRRA